MPFIYILIMFNEWIWLSFISLQWIWLSFSPHYHRHPYRFKCFHNKLLWLFENCIIKIILLKK